MPTSEMSEKSKTLPPAGDARRDELKKRADDLAAEADKLMAEAKERGVETLSLSADKLKEIAEEREIRNVTQLSGMEVSNADPEYHYAWVYRDPFNRLGGRMVTEMKVLGFDLVSGDMKEAREHKNGPCGERWIGDVVLMRIGKTRFELIQRLDAKKRAERHDVNGALRDLIAKNARFGARINEDFRPGA